MFEDIQPTVDRTVFEGLCICNQHQQREPLKWHHLAFNETGIWDYKHHPETLEASSSLCSQVQEHAHTISNVLPQKVFQLSDQRGIEISLASSLLHLTQNPWLQDSWKSDRIFLSQSQPLSVESAHTRWSPRIRGFLNPGIIQEADQYEEIASFGLLLMEIEAGKCLESAESNNGWDTEISATCVKLQTALDQWKANVEFPYREIASTCLEFATIVEGLYDPGIADNLRRNAAIYKHILEPLLRLSRKNHGDTMDHLRKFSLLLGLPAPNTTNLPQTFPEITLFDDSSSQPDRKLVNKSARAQILS